VKRISVVLRDDLADTLARAARRRNRSVSDVTRAGLAEHLGLGGDEPRRLPFAALRRSGHRETARKMEELLPPNGLELPP
jgi:hypothetical protein